ncbi:uncharacterized protein LOC112486464 [Cynoglossus semilaevis]|uniref:uncharacterized protein LOC112486464 n=1 Tax=Cynoglossus semilaevis TaxID=244447 RepID=UPI000D629D02|nr:uncharacterized protein LOC112486464 [Cynoglossus semilaevis]
MDIISRRSQVSGWVQFGSHRISSLLFADDVVLLASSNQDLQHALGRFAIECKATGMRISTSKSEAMVLDRKRMVCTLRVGKEVLPQVEEFKYFGLFTSEGRMEREIDRQIDAAATVMWSLYRCITREELEVEPLLLHIERSQLKNITSITKKAQQCIHFLRVLRKHNFSTNLLLSFYRSSIESLLTYCITVWFGSCTAADRERLQRVVKTAQRIIGCPLPSLMDIYHCLPLP